MKKNVVGQKIGAQLLLASDGSAFTGSVTVYVTVDAGTQSVGSVGSGACTHEGNGYHTYAPSQAETNGDLVAFTFTGTGAIPVTVQVYTSFPQTGDSFGLIGTAGSGLTSLAQASELAKVPKSDSNVTWNATAAAQIQSEANDALVANNLDHLVLSAVDTNFATTVHQNSVIGQLADSGGGFDRTTDSLEAIRDSASSPPSAATIADAVWDEPRASHVTPGSFGEGAASVQGSVAGNVGGNVTGSVGSVVGAVGSVTGNVGGNVTGSVGSVTGDVGGKVLGGGSGTITGEGVTALLSNGTGTGQVSYLGNGILNVNTERVNGTIQTAANIPGLLGTLAGAAATGDPDTSKTVLQYLKQLVNILAGSDGIATFPSAAAPGNAVSLAEAVRQIYTDLQTLEDYVDTEIAAIKAKTDTIPASPAATGDIPSAATNASAVRTELTTELGRIDAAISTRLASASYTAPLDAAGTRTAVGLASANLDTQLDALPTAAENATAVASQVTSDHGSGSYVRNTEPLDAAGVRSAVGLGSANLDTQLGTIDTVVDSILADTGTDGVVLSSSTLNAIADALLKRSVSSVEDTAAEHSLTTVALFCLESARSGTTLTIKKTDGSTTYLTKTLTVDPDADPITGVT